MISGAKCATKDFHIFHSIIIVIIIIIIIIIIVSGCGSGVGEPVSS